MLPNALANFVFPKMNYKLGQTNDPKLLWPMVLKINALFFLLAIPFAILIWVTAPYIMSNYFPNYSEATHAVQLFSLNFFFAGTMISTPPIFNQEI